MEKPAVKRQYALCLVALSCIFLRTWLVNDLFVPARDAFGAHWSPLITLFNVALYFGIAVLARYWPQAIPYRTATVVSLATLCVTPFASYFGSGSEAVTVIAFLAGSGANIWIAIRVFPSLCAFASALERNTCICFAYFIACVVQLPLRGSEIPELAVVTVLPFVIVAALGNPARRTFESMRTGTAAVDIAPLHPDSFLPPLHTLFGCIVICQMAFGFALGSSGEQGSPTILALIGLVPLAAGVRYALIKDASPAEDRFFRTFILVTVAGYLAAMVGATVSDQSFASTLFSLGSALFNILLWMSVTAIGQRNPLDSVWTFSWSMGASTLGMLAGRLLGDLSLAVAPHDLTMMLSILAVALFCFVAYCLTALKDFSIVQVIHGVRPLSAEQFEGTSENAAAEPSIESLVESRCRKLAKEYSLTERESEVLELLASGANARYVQDKLVISYHTVRTHIKHIYTKLDVHNREELIAVLQGKPREGGE